LRLAYLSYPYTKPDPETRTREVLELAKKIIKKNPDLVLIIPHIAVDHPELRDAIIENYGDIGFTMWDIEIIKRCDLFIVGSQVKYSESAGCVWELGLAKTLGKEIVRVEELL